MSFYQDESSIPMTEDRHRQREAHEHGPVLPIPEDVRDCISGFKDVGDHKFLANADHRHNVLVFLFCGDGGH